MLHRICAIAALTLITTVANAGEAELLTGHLYAADALPERMVGRIAEVRVIDLPDETAPEARQDLVNVVPVFRIEPGEAVEQPEVRGAIARVALYMADRYRLPMTEQDRQRYAAWSERYPVQSWERARNRATACAQGHGNPLVGPVKVKAIENCAPE
ncbi:endonuclease [Pseudomonas cremoricolorata]|uniref:endonuclease n=1 Tax=Pseudomonas cremoricolorata TaxID=157783 RepID=UPI000400DAB5|nr:endonuclease [Pseudomonas cremoricolorata]